MAAQALESELRRRIEREASDLKPTRLTLDTVSWGHGPAAAIGAQLRAPGSGHGSGKADRMSTGGDQDPMTVTGPPAPAAIEPRPRRRRLGTAPWPTSQFARSCASGAIRLPTDVAGACNVRRSGRCPANIGSDT